MRRLLVLLFALTFAAAGASPVDCRDSPGISRQHACCAGQDVAIAPAGNCCVLSQQPVSPAVLEARTASTKQEFADSPATGTADPLQSRGVLPAPPRTRSAVPAHGTPIYLEHRSLLI